MALFFTAWPVILGDFLWDDRSVFVGNPAITAPDGFGMIWRGISVWDFLPLTYSLFRVWYGFFGASAPAFHVLNLILHLLGCLLLVATLKRIGVRGAWWATALFALHPVNAASAGWIAEIKNTLSLPLALGAVIAFFSRGWMTSFVLAPALFAASLLSKSSPVGLPLVLLLICWWRRDSLDGRLIRKLIPWLGLSLAAGVIAVYFQLTKAMGVGSESPITDLPRMVVRALWAVGFDLRQIVWPDNLSFLYGNRNPMDGATGPWLFLAGAAALTLFAWPRREQSQASRAWLAAFGSFLVLVAPVLGFIPMEYLKLAPVADHWLYLPMIPLTALAGAWVSALPPLRGGLLAVAVLTTFGALSRERYEAMSTPLTFWNSVLSQDPVSPGALRNLAVLYSGLGRHDEALSYARQDTHSHPESLTAMLNEAGVMATASRREEALNLSKDIVVRWPASCPAWVGYGDLLMGSSLPREALASYDHALAIDPHWPRALLGKAKAMYDLDDPEGMVGTLNTLLREEPESLEILNLLGAAHAALGQRDLALKCWKRALILSPNNQDIIRNIDVMNHQP